MAIATTGELLRLPFANRPDFGNPYPEGIAVGHIDITGDASGGGLSASFLSDGGFLFRLELVQATKSGAQETTFDYITAHRWATDRSGFGATAFDLNWIFERSVTGINAFQTYRPFLQDLQMLKRFPMGRTDDAALQFVFLIETSNVDAIVYDFDLVCSYWRKEALYRPGFLQAFWSEPIVPAPLAR